MKYVKVLNEQWFDDMLSDYENAFQKLYHKFQLFNYNVVPHHHEFQSTPIEKYGKEFPFPFAADLYTVYMWLIGKKKRPANTEDILEQIYHLVWFNPFVDYTETIEEGAVSERWTGEMGAHTGQFYRFAKTALKVDTGQPINATDLSFLSSMTISGITKQIKEGNLQASKVKKEWLIESKEAIAWIKKKDWK